MSRRRRGSVFYLDCPAVWRRDERCEDDLDLVTLRGIAYGFLVVLPFWVGVALLLWWLT